ncbi:periplasmic binding family protein, partial [Vibrio parahaemolyticus AQ3810]
NEQ